MTYNYSYLHDQVKIMMITIIKNWSLLWLSALSICAINFLMISIIFLLETLKKKYIACISILIFFTWDFHKFQEKYNRSIITIPTMRSSALSLMDSSLSSKHCRTISLKTVTSVRSAQKGFTIIITKRHWGVCNNHYWNRNQWIRMM